MRTLLGVVFVFTACASPGRNVVAPAPAPESLDRNVIREVIHSNRDKIRVCYESALTEFPALEGTVRVRFAILPTGLVGSAEIATPSTGSPRLDDCVVASVRTFVFPKPTDAGTVHVNYPFIFKQAASSSAEESAPTSVRPRGPESTLPP